MAQGARLPTAPPTSLSVSEGARHKNQGVQIFTDVSDSTRPIALISVGSIDCHGS